MALKKIENRAGKRKPNPTGGVDDLWTAFEALTLKVVANERAHQAAVDERDQRIVALEEVIAHQAIAIDALGKQVGRVGELEESLAAATAAHADLAQVVATLPTPATLEEAVASMVAATVELEKGLADAIEATAATSRDAMETEVTARQALALELTRTTAAALERVAALETALPEFAGEASASAAAQMQAVTAVTERLEALRADHLALSEQTTGVAARLEDVAALAPQVAAVTTAQGEAAAAAAEQVHMVAEVCDRLEALEAARADLGEQVTGVAARLEDVAALAPQVAELARSQGEMGVQVHANTQTIAGAEERLERVNDAIDEVTAALGRVETSTTESVDQVRAAAAEAAEATERELAGVRAEAGRIVSSLPKNLIVDQDGDLIGVTGAGELVRVGRVRGTNGNDGATVEDVQLVDGRLRVAMTDGRRLDAGAIPVAPPVVMSEDVLRDKVLALHAEGKSYTKIASELGTDRRKVSRLVKGKSSEAKKPHRVARSRGASL